jgi:hypothetical protein
MPAPHTPAALADSITIYMIAYSPKVITGQQWRLAIGAESIDFVRRKLMATT